MFGGTLKYEILQWFVVLKGPPYVNRYIYGRGVVGRKKISEKIIALLIMKKIKVERCCINS